MSGPGVRERGKCAPKGADGEEMMSCHGRRGLTGKGRPGANFVSFACSSGMNRRAGHAINASIRRKRRKHNEHKATLARTNWRIDGPKGAALLLGIKPSTLLDITRESTGLQQ